MNMEEQDFGQPSESDIESHLRALRPRQPGFEFDAIQVHERIRMREKDHGDEEGIGTNGTIARSKVVAYCSISAAIAGFVVFGMMQMQIWKLEQQIATQTNRPRQSVSSNSENAQVKAVMLDRASSQQRIARLTLPSKRRPSDGRHESLGVGSHLSAVAFYRSNRHLVVDSLMDSDMDDAVDVSANQLPMTRARILESLRDM